MPPHADVLQWEHLPFPKSLRDFQKLFPDDAACARYLEGAKWPKGFVCPHCGEKGEPVRRIAFITSADEIERLRAALWPFSERHRINSGVCYDDYRRAYEALNEQNGMREGK